MRRRMLALLFMFLLFSGFAVVWDPVTKYVDGTSIGPEAQGVYYQMEADNVIASGTFTGTSWTIPPALAVRGTSHTFRVRTVLGATDNTGQPYRSAWSPAQGWTVPLVEPERPGVLRVVPSP